MKSISYMLRYMLLAIVGMGTLLQSGFAQQTICNPLNISYRFYLELPSRREAADPTIVLYKDDYYLFASKLGGYYYSPDLVNWNFVTTSSLPIENYAPTAVVVNDSLYYLANETSILYRTADPKSGKWEIANTSFPVVGDPAFFEDTDGKVYLYHGVSNNDYIKGVEVDAKNNFNWKGANVNLFKGNPSENGWERPGDYNELTASPWIEAPWMTKHDGKYYLQYSAPGTEYKSYSDGYYTSDHPLGPFTYAKTNPFSSKPEGFITGAGHGATFQDKFGNWWHTVYKNPEYIFFDEATSALDSENERIIHENLMTFFRGKTVLIIAHRLSTVKNADQVIVMKNGKIVEIGSHSQLVRNQSEYFNLVKNQLELGA